MIILTIRTDKPEAEVGLYEGTSQLAYNTWQAHRELAETIHVRIRELLHGQGKALEQLQGIVVYEGPGSFTGLRIGVTVANALAESLGLAIVGTGGDGWLERGLQQLMDGQDTKLVLPEYGALPNITQPHK